MTGLQRSSSPRSIGPGARRGSFVAGLGLGVLGGFVAATGRRFAVRMRLGAGHPLKHRVLDLAAGTLQRRYPVEAVSTYLNGFHLYADDLGRQVEASHFCIHLRPDLHQCVIFDRNAPDARLIGIEYIVSAERYAALPADEQRLWHSHHHEVSSGVLAAPGVPEIAEHAYFEDLITTYGKTFHTWQYDRDDFPYGVPQLMMAFTEDGQADEGPIGDRDRRLGRSSAARARRRADIPVPDVEPRANEWTGGRTLQTRADEVEVHRPSDGT